ncbi:MAG TPA: glycosyltransferase [Acidimicrobiia bacterium]|nr:glycosyltransferase [Acidimicrobiia bacterium]
MSPDVVLVSPYSGPGRTQGTSGVVWYTASLARALTDLGVSVAVVAPDDIGGIGYDDDGVQVVRSGPIGPMALAHAIQMAAEMGPDVVHLQHELFLFGGVTSLVALPLALRQMRRLTSATVTTVHQVLGVKDIRPEVMRLHGFRGPLAAARGALNLYQRLIASAGATIVHEQKFLEHFPDAVLISHGVESRSVPSTGQARERLGITGEQRLVVLCFGFVAPYKGLELSLAAAANTPEILLVVAGGNHPRHRAYAERLRDQYQDVALFTGWIDDQDVTTWHAAADLALFCYPAPHSSSGALATALGHGTPFLASEAMVDLMSLPGELAVPLVPTELSERLRCLEADRDSLANLRQTSASIASGRCWEDVARLHLQLYEQLSKGRLLTATGP